MMGAPRDRLTFFNLPLTDKPKSSDGEGGAEGSCAARRKGNT